MRGFRFFCFGLGAWGALACESEEPKRAPVVSVHPDFPLPPSPEMIAESNPQPNAPRGEAARDGSPAAGSASVSWSATCVRHRGCTRKERPLTPCETGRTAASWSDLQRSAEGLVGKTVDVSGALGLAPARASTRAACAPGSCCNALRLAVTLDGSPMALPLQGLACIGDDSQLCCSVPADGQLAIARGRLARASGTGVAKFRLEGVSLCAAELPSPPDH